MALLDGTIYNDKLTGLGNEENTLKGYKGNDILKGGK